jgi:hypothetical protein
MTLKTSINIYLAEVNIEWKSGEVGRYNRRERKVDTSFPKYQ